MTPLLSSSMQDICLKRLVEIRSFICAGVHVISSYRYTKICRVECATCLHTRNHLIKEIGRVRHRRINCCKVAGFSYNVGILKGR